MAQRIKMKMDDERIQKRKSIHWEVAEHRMSEKDLEKIKNMNWEWYYNCYLHKDEPIAVMCKVCKGFNIFPAGIMTIKCSHCGIECRRCEVDEDKK